MKQAAILGAFIFAGILAHPLFAEQFTGTFSIKQSKGLGLSGDDRATVRISIQSGAPGVKERGMAGSAQIRFKGVISEISISTPTKEFTFQGAFDVLVMPLRKQWVGGGVNSIINTESDEPQLQSFTVSLEYPEGILGQNSPVPPEGGMPASKARAFTMGVDLFAMGRLEDSTKEWSIAGELISYEVAK